MFSANVVINHDPFHPGRHREVKHLTGPANDGRQIISRHILTAQQPAAGLIIHPLAGNNGKLQITGGLVRKAAVNSRLPNQAPAVGIRQPRRGGIDPPAVSCRHWPRQLRNI